MPYNVDPRYTPGSPAQVPEEIARKVAEEERHFIEHALEGVWGEENKCRAERLGLRGIVEQRVERRDHWEVYDLCTGERFKRLFPEKLRKQGFRRYPELEAWEKKLIDDNPPTDMQDPHKGWFKIEVRPFTIFPTGHEVIPYRPQLLEPLS